MRIFSEQEKRAKLRTASDARQAARGGMTPAEYRHHANAALDAALERASPALLSLMARLSAQS